MLAPAAPDRSLAATALETRLAEGIAANGPLRVDQFMQAALYDPDCGYYATRDPLGLSGDFTTGPEISQMFGELLGLWVAQCWIDMGCPAPFTLLELGPGRGTLMADALRAAGAVSGFSAATSVILVEINPHLKAAQARALEASGMPVAWRASLQDVALETPAMVIANEYLDCLPIRQFPVTDGHLHERLVGLDDTGRLTFTPGPALGAAPQGLSDGVVLERCDGLRAFTDWLAIQAARAPLRALLIDYGDAGPPGDTLQALWRHTKVHPLDRIGEADLTAHVNFAALAGLARAASPRLSVQGPVTQSAFLESLGIHARCARLVHANPAREEELAGALERLTSPMYMGHLFKVISLASSGLPDAPCLGPAS